MRRTDAVWLALTVLCGVVVQVASLAFLIDQGFVSVSADEFSRSLRSQRWAAAPTAVWWSGVWMPAELYLNGASHWLFDDPLAGPRLTVFLCSLVLLVGVAMLARRLFHDRVVTLLAVVLVASHPWYVALSGTPMLDVYYLAFFVLGLVGLCRWLALSEDVSQRGAADRALVLAGLCFMFASAFHVSSWLFIGAAHLALLPVAFQALRTRPLPLLAHGALAYAFIVYYLAATWRVEGSITATFTEHATYTRWFRDGYDVSVAAKLGYYPMLLARRDWLLLALAVPAACVAFVRVPRAWLPACVAVAGLAAASIFNVFSVPPSAAPGRYVLPYVVLLSPYVAWGLWTAVRSPRPGWRRGIATVAAAVAICALVVTHVERLASAKVGLHADSIATGRALRALVDADAIAPGRILLERHYWEYLAVLAAAGLPDGVTFDRPGTKRDRNAPSMLARRNMLLSFIDRHATAVLVVRSHMPPPRRAWLRHLAAERSGGEQRVGAWTIYRFRPRAPSPRSGLGSDGRRSGRARSAGARVQNLAAGVGCSGSYSWRQTTGHSSQSSTSPSRTRS